MASNSTRQYRPISSSETSTDDPLSVPFCQRMADNLNNWHEYVGNHKVMAQICVPEWRSFLGHTDERVVWISAARTIPDGYYRLAVLASHYQVEGTGDTRWKMYCSSYGYDAFTIFDSTKLSSDYSAAAWTTSSSNHGRVVDTTPTIARNSDGLTYFILTAENTVADTVSALTTIDIWPYPGFDEAVFVL